MSVPRWKSANNDKRIVILVREKVSQSCIGMAIIGSLKGLQPVVIPCDLQSRGCAICSRRRVNIWGNPARLNKVETMTNQLNTRVNAAIKTATNNSTKQHELLVDCLDHARTTGDWTLLARLVNGLAATSVRAGAIKTWIETFSPYNSAVDDTGAVRFTMPKNDKRRPWMIDDAAANPFWELTVEKEVKAIDVIKLLESIAKRVETGKEKGTEIVPVDAEALKAAMLKVIAAV